MTAAQERVGRVAMASILGVVTGILLQAICGDFGRAAAVWLAYTLVCAAVINSSDGERVSAIAWMALLPAAVPPLVLVYPFLFLNGSLCFSAVPLSSKAISFVLELAGFFVAVSYIGIVLFAFARSWLLNFVRALTDPQLTKKLKTADAVLKATVALVGSLGLLYLAVTQSSS
ncbi:MAG TPA: hypothetical protein VNA69_14970 [Thermoanaerobaculia bacterium]|nr:hypothetical protein [Thermoanaerobaculia bacterium]